MPVPPEAVFVEVLPVVVPTVVTKQMAMEDPIGSRQLLIDVPGAFLLIEKPYGYTSFSLVNQIRRRITLATGIKRVKVGHAGTLDPLATGLLILATRRCTKTIPALSIMDKVYLVRMRLGITTPSHDLETQIVIAGDPRSVGRSNIEEVVLGLEASVLQTPPIFSAIKQQGKAVYLKARAGKEVTMESRAVVFHQISIVNISLPYVTLSVHCGKGTYIRSLVRDIGEQLGVGAVMIDLERTAVGPYELEDALKYDEAIALLELRPIPSTR
jgi:tRNA pseudouridine55 synthase